MKFVKFIFMSLLVCGTASAKIKVTFQNDAVRNLDSLTVKDGRIFIPEENTLIPFAQVVSAEFNFEGFSIEQCRTFFDQGDYAGIISRLADKKSSLLAAASLQGNASDWLLLLLRAQFHSGDYAAARSTMQILQNAGNLLSGEVPLYKILLLIEDEKIAEAAQAFDTQKPSDKAAAEFILARLALAREDYKVALQHLARVQIFHYREKEWMPGALFYEGLVCQRAESPTAAGFAILELETLYPVSRWCQMAKDQLQ